MIKGIEIHSSLFNTLYFIYLTCYHVDPIVPDIHGKLTNGKTNNFIKNTMNVF